MEDNVNKNYPQPMIYNKFALKVNSQENIPIKSMSLQKIPKKRKNCRPTRGLIVTIVMGKPKDVKLKISMILLTTTSSSQNVSMDINWTRGKMILIKRNIFSVLQSAQVLSIMTPIAPLNAHLVLKDATFVLALPKRIVLHAPMAMI